MKQQTYTLVQWSLFTLAVLLPFVAWGQGVNWRIGGLSGYQWFPLFGLLAWMVMWTHYANGALRLSYGNLKKTRGYGKFTAYFVLLALLLHPGILAYEQFNNDAGLPPASFIDYVGESLGLAILLGSLSLTIFLSFEVFERLKKRPWIERNWRYISISQSLAMVLIFVHAMRLGSTVMDGWFQLVWFFCGLLLLPCFYIIHKFEFNQSTDQKSS